MHAVAAGVIVLASQAGDASCEDLGSIGYSCHVNIDGPSLSETGRVVAVVENRCDEGLGPQSQDFYTWIETRRSPDDRWLVIGKNGNEHRPPPAGGDTYRLRDGRCQADIEYGVAWRARGADHNGVPFDTEIKRKRFGRTDLC